jgi:hypothetical protein
VNVCDLRGVGREFPTKSRECAGCPIFVKEELALIEIPAVKLRAFFSVHDPVWRASKLQAENELNNVSRHDIICGLANDDWRITHGQTPSRSLPTLPCRAQIY